MPRGRRTGYLVAPVLMLGLSLLAGCSSSPGATPSPSPHGAQPSPSATPAPTTVTVIAPLGVNLRTGPSTSASITGVLAQGVSLPIVSHTPAAGGWWEVRASDGTGWVTADPDYTSTLSFQTFSVPGAARWSVMYPEGWTFAQKSTGSVVFTGPPGTSITFDTAASTSQLPPAATAGEVQSGVSSVVVYGVTAPLVTYSSSSGYQTSVEFQAQASLAFLIQASLPRKGGAATFNLFLETVFFPIPATPTP